MSVASCAPGAIRDQGEEGRAGTVGSQSQLVCHLLGPTQQPNAGCGHSERPHFPEALPEARRRAASPTAGGRTDLLLAAAPVSSILGVRNESRDAWWVPMVSASRIQVPDTTESGQRKDRFQCQTDRVPGAAPPPTGCVTLVGVCFPICSVEMMTPV